MPAADSRALEISRSGKSCEECHRDLTPVLFAAWEGSRHAAKGVTCQACHGRDHSTIFSHKGEVSARVCGGCHAKQVEEFGRSLHAQAAALMEADPKFQRLSPAVAQLGCEGCHQVGERWPDGSAGKCNTCHSGHAFSVTEARQPQACAACHGGPDHAQMEMWQASKHGQLYASETTRAQAPTCVTCHMPGGTHDTGRGLTLGNVANGAVLVSDTAPVRMRTIAPPAARQERTHMVQTCLPCHSSRFAAASLEEADQVKREADRILGEAATLVTGLYDDGLLQRATTTQEELAASGHAAGPAFVLGGDQVYSGLSSAEQIFFDLYKFHHATMFKGAYHSSPEFTHNRGYLPLQQGLTALQHEASQLRESARARGAASSREKPRRQAGTPGEGKR